MHVMKFGGTSVMDADAIRRLAAIVGGRREQTGTAPLVVVSAMAGVTDQLLKLVEAAERRESDVVDAEVPRLRERHFGALQALVPRADAADSVRRALEKQFDELQAVLDAVAILREATPRARDEIASAGELSSSRIVAAALTAAGVPAVWVDARRVMVTDDSHSAATPLLDETRDALTRELAARGDAVLVVGGYVGATRDGVTTTLGRGGSDYSASIFGAASRAREIEIWTDVDGMMTADPRIIADAVVVPQLSFAEASELAYFGAKVLHPSTILPAMAQRIPVRILNSRRPEVTGTLITGQAPTADRPLAAIACKRGITVIDITSTRMLMAHGFMHGVFEAFERQRTAVDVVSTSEVSVSVTIDDERRAEPIVDALREYGEVDVEHGMAIVCAVGDGLQRDARLAGRIIGLLEGLPLRMVSQAASRRNLTVVVREEDAPAAMERLHAEFFGVPRPSSLVTGS
jgi:aspartate kinase